MSYSGLFPTRSILRDQPLLIEEKLSVAYFEREISIVSDETASSSDGSLSLASSIHSSTLALSRGSWRVSRELSEFDDEVHCERAGTFSASCHTHQPQAASQAVREAILSKRKDTRSDSGPSFSVIRDRRHVAFSSNTRADWAKLRPLAEILVENGFEVDIFVIGMHMVEDYGSTYLDIVRCNPKFRVFTRKTWSQGDSQIKNATATVQATYELLQQSNYDLLIVHGDHLEAKAAADAAHLYGCRLGHIEGGNLTGGDDNKNRFAMTAVADYHFPSSQSAAERLLLAGQRAESIFTIGSPDLDIFFGEISVSLEEVMTKYKIPFADFGIAPFHSNSAESDVAGEQAKQVYGCLVASRRNFIVPRPNNDRGTEAVQAVIDSLPRDRFYVAPNFELDDYIVLLRAAGCVIGNSSVVVTAAPAIGKLCLNIGNRQRGRAPPIEGLFHFDTEDCEGILDCFETHWGITYKNNNYNGDGHAAVRFLEALKSERFWQISQQKLLFDQKA